MFDLNSVSLIGRLTRDPELNHTQSGKALCKFSLAVNKGKNEASFFDIVVWDKQAENCNTYLKKGSLTAVSGRLNQDRWEKDGKKYSKVVVVAVSVQFLNTKDGQGQSPSGKQNNNDDDGFEEDESIPF